MQAAGPRGRCAGRGTKPRSARSRVHGRAGSTSSTARSPGSTQPTWRSISTSSIRRRWTSSFPSRTDLPRPRSRRLQHCRQDAARGNGHHGVPRHRAQRGTCDAHARRGWLREPALVSSACLPGKVALTSRSRASARTSAVAGKAHPNTCPSCGSHYRDDELADAPVCPQCGHHFRVGARDRIEQLVDPGSFVEGDAELRSADPLEFFDLRPYTERLAEAEVETGLGDAIVCGAGEIEDEACDLAVMDFAFMGGSMGSGEKFVAIASATRTAAPVSSRPRVARACRRNPRAHAAPQDDLRHRRAARVGWCDALRADASHDGRRARELREPGRRRARGARCAHVVRRPAGRLADDPARSSPTTSASPSRTSVRTPGRDRPTLRAACDASASFSASSRAPDAERSRDAAARAPQ